MTESEWLIKRKIENQKECLKYIKYNAEVIAKSCEKGIKRLDKSDYQAETGYLNEKIYQITLELQRLKRTNKVEMYKCVICGETNEGYGNNPDPVKKEGRCCNDCDNNKVIPARIILARRYF